jgi:hypothetical protein
MLWTIVSTAVAILSLTLGVARYVAARRKAAADRALGAAETNNAALTEVAKAAQDRIKTDAEVVKLPDATTDARLDKWMRD